MRPRFQADADFNQKNVAGLKRREGVYTGSVADGFSGRAISVLFYSADRDEPPHVHVEREDSEAKFWLVPTHLEGSRGFGRAELLKMEFSLPRTRCF